MNKLLHKKLNKKGFTLAELLIVVAIIAVLVAIAIPVFTKRLEFSRETTDMANLRSAYAAAQVKVLVDGTDGVGTWYFDPTGAAVSGSGSTATASDDALTKTKPTKDAAGIGQGTSYKGGAKTSRLPSVVTYTDDTDARDKLIQVVINADGNIDSIEFVAAS